MQLSNIPGKLVLPFANGGSKNSIPVTSQIGITPGAASLTDGFPPLTMTPVAAGGVPPSGLDMNGILYEISAIIRWANAGGGYPFDADFATDTNVNGYPKGARIMRADGLGYWFNTVENNVTDPESAGAAAAGWVPDFTTGVAAVTMASANVTLTPAQYGKPVIVITGALTTNLNLIFPNIVGQWIVINNTTGNFTITAKTAAAAGVAIPQGFSGNVYGDGNNVYSRLADLSSPSGSNLIGYTYPGQIARSLSERLGDVLSLKDFGAKGNGVSDDTAAWQTAVIYCATNSKALFVPDGVYPINAKALVDGDTTAFMSVRIYGNGRATGPSAKYLQSKAGPVILTSGGGAIEIWFKRFFNENVDIRGISFVDTATFVDNGRAATPAIKIKKGSPPVTENRYATNNNFIDIAAAGYVDPIVFQGMYPNEAPYSWLWNFFGPTHIARYYPYECGSGLALNNCTMNRLRVSESLWSGLSLGGLILRKDGDLPAGTGTGGLIMGVFDTVHFEGVSGCFRIPAGLEALISSQSGGGDGHSTLTLRDVTREYCGIYGPVGPGGTYAGNPYGIESATNLIIEGRCDKDIAYGDTERINLPANSSISSTSPILLKMIDPTKAEVFTPNTVNFIDEKHTVAAGGSLVMNIRVAEGAGVDFDAQVDVSVAGGSYGSKKLHTYGRTGGTVYRDEAGGTGASGATITFANGGSTSDMVQITMANASEFSLEFRIRMETRSGIQTYLI